MLSIAVIGAGRIGHVHAKTIAAHPQAELALVCDPFEDAAEKLAASYGARGYGTQPSLRSGRRPAPSSGSDTSAIKVVGWVLIIIIIFLIRILTG